jgi:hypothetical protein
VDLGRGGGRGGAFGGVGQGLWEGRTEEVVRRLTVWADVDGMVVRVMVCRCTGSWLEKGSISQSQGLNS